MNDAIINLENNYSQEKVILLLDSDFYNSGDIIFFKAFVLDGYKASQISTTLFVEFYNSEKKLIDKKTILLKNGEGNGSVTLNKDLNEDVYYLRAYTTLMANFPEEFQTIQSVLIGNKASVKKLQYKDNKSWTAEIFPESGNMISSIPTKFVVRRQSHDNSITTWSGFVINKLQPNKKIVEFNSLDENVAVFTLKPEKGVEYQSVITSNTDKITIDLLTSTNSGVALEVFSLENEIKYKIKGIGLKDNLKDYRIVGTINNLQAYNIILKNNLKEYDGIIPTTINQGSNGVLMLTVFDNNEEMVAQRLCFIKPNSMNIKKPIITPLPFDKAPEAENLFEVMSSDYYPNIFVRVQDVTDNEFPKNTSATNFLSELYLSHDFNNKIINPGQYFTSRNNSDALDALLISEKWKRFSWPEVLAGHKPEIKYKTQQYLSFKGKLTLDGVSLKNTEINIIAETGNSSKDIFKKTTDDTGSLIIDNIDSEETIKITYFLKPNSDKKKAVLQNLALILEPEVQFSPLKMTLYQNDYHLVNKNKDELANSIIYAKANEESEILPENGETLIDGVEITKTLRQKTADLNKELSLGLLRSMNAIIFDFVNNDYVTVASENILLYLQGKVANLTVSNFKYYIRNYPLDFYLDDLPIDQDQLERVYMKDIAMVKVMRNSVVGNAIAVYTRKPGMYLDKKSKSKEESKYNSVVIKGYDKSLRYQQPYFNDQLTNISTNQTLYFNPDYKHANGAPVIVKFINNKSPKRNKVTAIGLNNTGKILYYDETF